MNRALPFLAAAAHLAASTWLLTQVSGLWDMLLRGDAGAGMVLVLGGALIVVGARTSAAVLLLLAARLAALISSSTGRGLARLAIAVSPSHLRRSLIGSAAGLVVVGSAAWSPVVAAPHQPDPGATTAAHSPAWSSPAGAIPSSSTVSATPAAAQSPGWPTEGSASPDPEESPGWPANEPGAPHPEESPGWPVSEPPDSHQSPGSPTEEAGVAGDSAAADLPRQEADTDSPAPPPTEQQPPPGPDPGPDTKPRPDPATEPAAATVVVAPGDTLWSIAADLRPAAGSAPVADTVEDLYHANQDRIGPDPNLIIPGMRLETL
ncbi:hypothetical protein GCM10022261_26730 [Brevibacterium daeguense]|uniref:LysM domain-containing protein n=1 Tax=Brevibacterium daeguense TaxID=909936 RepID=A0ABP8EMY5_9MICO|nr:LysM domain-containing protein [Brevibacterium daeguense]